jgi:hypothetical protein
MTAPENVPAVNLTDVKVGDTVIRYLAGVIPVPLRVTKVTATLIHCYEWSFDRRTGAEIDDALGWGVHGTGSFLRRATDPAPTPHTPS